MSDKKNSQSTAAKGIGFCEALALIFIILKLLNKISWSWWWVCAPLWMPVALFIFIFAIFFTILIFRNK